MEKALGYFGAVTREVFTCKGKRFEPWGGINVSPAIFGSMSCPVNCGACCSWAITVDVLPSEPHSPGAEPRRIERTWLPEIIAWIEDSGGAPLAEPLRLRG